MKILHVVTLMTPDASYGGPVRVALNQAAALATLGHEVTVIAGQRGYPAAPPAPPGVRLILFPVHTLIPRSGFAGLCSPSLAAWVFRRSPQFDVVHIHVARDLVTLPAAGLALARGASIVLQPHGMIDRSDKLLSRPLDWLLTRPIIARATTIFFLTDVEKRELSQICDDPRKLAYLPNGVPADPPFELTENTDTEVLFLARLHQRKRPQTFVQAAEIVLSRGHRATFTLVGPDEGEADAVQRLIDLSAYPDSISWTGPVAPEHTLRRMKEALFFVLPSVDEPFPMVVLEALSVGLPVIVTDSCGLAEDIERHGCGLVVSESPNELADAMERLLADAGLRQTSSENAYVAGRSVFSIDAVATRLDHLYSDARLDSR